MRKPERLTAVVALLSSFYLQANDRQPGGDAGYQPVDGIVRLYGPGGPHTALIKAAAKYQNITGQRVEIIYGPEKRWSEEARKQADGIFNASEQSMLAYLENYPFVSVKDVRPMFMHASVIVVPKGNPRNIRQFDDLIRQPLKIVVTEGKGTYNTSGTGLWEDIAGRLGRLEDIKKVRENIVAYEQGSGAAFKAFQEMKADAWITWNDWAVANPGKTDVVAIEPERRIYRDFNLVISAKADAGAKKFADWLNTEEGAKFFLEEGWLR